MKTISKIAAILLIPAGIFLACGEEGDIDMSNIDFSNIENLYAQPLPVIQKAVQGKWTVYSSSGGVAGITYPENCFEEYTGHQLIRNLNGEVLTNSYSWKKKTVIDYDNKEIETYFIVDGSEWGTFCHGIKNDTLYLSTMPLDRDEIYQYPLFGTTLIRIE
jgi:hypothetical protein